MRAIEQYAIGEEKLSITITRKTKGDRLISQHSSERWFTSDASTATALRRILQVFIEPDGERGE